MSNYFDNLIARTFDQAPVLQPRPLSLFESWSTPDEWRAAPESAADTLLTQSASQELPSTGSSEADVTSTSLNASTIESNGEEKRQAVVQNSSSGLMLDKEVTQMAKATPSIPLSPQGGQQITAVSATSPTQHIKEDQFQDNQSVALESPRNIIATNKLAASPMAEVTADRMLPIPPTSQLAQSERTPLLQQLNETENPTPQAVKNTTIAGLQPDSSLAKPTVITPPIVQLAQPSRTPLSQQLNETENSAPQTVKNTTITNLQPGSPLAKPAAITPPIAQLAQPSKTQATRLSKTPKEMTTKATENPTTVDTLTDSPLAESVELIPKMQPTMQMVQPSETLLPGQQIATQHQVSQNILDPDPVSETAVFVNASIHHPPTTLPSTTQKQRQAATATIMDPLETVATRDKPKSTTPAVAIEMAIGSSFPRSPLAAKATAQPEREIRESTTTVAATHLQQPKLLATLVPTNPLHTSKKAVENNIQVSIGRIEVRATPPPAPPTRKKRPLPQGLSLDEYLNQRNQGGSR